MSLASKLQLLGALRKAREALQATQDPLTKLRHIKEVRSLRAKLGAHDGNQKPTEVSAEIDAKTVATEPEGAPISSINNAVNEHHKALIDISKGASDGAGLAEMFGQIQEAVNGLNDDLILEGQALDAANAAVTHWGSLDHQLNG